MSCLSGTAIIRIHVSGEVQHFIDICDTGSQQVAGFGATGQKETHSYVRTENNRHLHSVRRILERRIRSYCLLLRYSSVDRRFFKSVNKRNNPMRHELLPWLRTAQTTNHTTAENTVTRTLKILSTSRVLRYLVSHKPEPSMHDARPPAAR